MTLAQANDAEVRGLIITIERTWVKIARLCAKSRDHQWHKKLGFTRFNDWLYDAVGRRKSTIRLGMQAVDELAEVPEEQLQNMTLDNASKLARVPKSKRSPALVEAAQREKGKEFTRTVNRAVPNLISEEPSGGHFEVWGEPSLITVAEQAIQIAMILERTDSLSVAFERVVSEFVLRHPEPELERAALDQVEKDQVTLDPGGTNAFVESAAWAEAALKES